MHNSNGNGESLNRRPGASGRLPEALLTALASYLDANLTPKLRRRSSTLRQTERCCSVLEEPVCAAMSAPREPLEEYLRQTDAGFTEMLLRLIDQSGKTDAQIYKRANLSRQHFSKIRSNPGYRPTKATAVALALALELELDQLLDLLGRAGFTLSSSSKFDLIIRYFIELGNYDVTQINMALYEFDQELLGR